MYSIVADIVDGKIMGRNNYGHIGHLPGSRLGPSDRKCSPGQVKMATEKVPGKNYFVICQEKLDGSNVGVFKKDGVLYPITRRGYHAMTSPYQMHHEFARWVQINSERFDKVINDGERIVGEWLYQAHGTRYDLPHEPFVAFDIMRENERLIFSDFNDRILVSGFTAPGLISIGSPISIDDAVLALGNRGFHGAIDKPEGAVWRIEKKYPTGKTKVIDLVKFVRCDKVDGCYFGLGDSITKNTVNGKEILI